jgi:hypothetical protein
VNRSVTGVHLRRGEKVPQLPREGRRGSKYLPHLQWDAPQLMRVAIGCQSSKEHLGTEAANTAPMTPACAALLSAGMDCAYRSIVSLLLASQSPNYTPLTALPAPLVRFSSRSKGRSSGRSWVRRSGSLI